MIRWGQFTGALVGVGILAAVVFPWTSGAQEEQFIDCRVRPCEVEDIVKALQPPRATTRGIPTMAVPMAAMPAIALNVYFKTNSTRIDPKYYTDLNKLGEALIQLQSSAEISGYTDSVGSDQANQLLSERRAMSVKRYLEQHFSLPTERLVAKGYGKSRPRATNDTESGMKQNRRIEVALPKP